MTPMAELTKMEFLSISPSLSCLYELDATQYASTNSLSKSSQHASMKCSSKSSVARDASSLLRLSST